MANVDAKFGLRPVRTLGSENVNQNVYAIATNYATAIYTGDPVQMTGTGKNVILAEAGNVDNIGVFVGCSYTDANGKPTFSAYWPGVSDGKADIKSYVVSDPETIFEIQADGCVAAEVGVLVDWVAGTGSALTGLSGAYAAASGKSDTTGKSLRVMGLVDRPDNAYGAYAKIEVMFATHVLGRVVSGLGGI